MSSDTSFATYVHYGTNAQRLAFTPAPGGGQPVYFWYETDTGSSYVYDTSWHLLTSSAGDVAADAVLTAGKTIVGNGTTHVTVSALTATIVKSSSGTLSGASAGTDYVAPGGALGTPSSGTLGAAILGSMAAYINLQDQKSQNTNGGTLTAGSWQTRVLNTEVSDVGGFCSLASNQFTLAAGTYIIHASAPAFAVNANQTRIYNVTDSAVVLTGSNAYSDSTTGGAASYSTVRGIFTIAASKALEFQHQCQTTKATNGLGPLCNFTTEVYAIVELWKIG